MVLGSQSSSRASRPGLISLSGLDRTASAFDALRDVGSVCSSTRPFLNLIFFLTMTFLVLRVEEVHMKKAAPTHCCVVRPERGSYCMLSAPCRLPKLYRNGAGAFGSLALP